MGIYKQVRVYYKRGEVETSWTQPVLSANGTIGDNAFACAASSEVGYDSIHNQYYTAWKAFNGITPAQDQDGYWMASSTSLPQWLEWYNPNPLKITRIQITGGGNMMGVYVGQPTTYQIQTSNDNINWSTIYNGTNSSASTNLIIDIDINNYYKYWRIYITATYYNLEAIIREITITATQIVESIVPGTPDDYDFYEDVVKEIDEFYKGSTKIGSLYKGSILVFGSTQTIYEQTIPGIYTITIPFEADFKITAVGGGGRANYRGVYDDRGYIGCGGSGGAFVGKIHLTAGRYNVQIGSCATNANRDTYIEDVLSVGGGGDGATNPIGGAAGATPTFEIQPVSQDLNTAGNAGGAYSSGNGGGGATWNYGGAASVYNGYGRGGGGKVCEYASTSTANEASGEPYNPTNGYLKIEI